jgi:hypothetical protein
MGDRKPIDDAFTVDRGLASSSAVTIVVALLRKTEIPFKELNCMHKRAMAEATKTAILCFPYPEIFRAFDGELAELISIKIWVQSLFASLAQLLLLSPKEEAK